MRITLYKFCFTVQKLPSDCDEIPCMIRNVCRKSPETWSYGWSFLTALYDRCLFTLYLKPVACIVGPQRATGKPELLGCASLIHKIPLTSDSTNIYKMLPCGPHEDRSILAQRTNTTDYTILLSCFSERLTTTAPTYKKLEMTWAACKDGLLSYNIT